MTQDELIAKQALEIAELREKVAYQATRLRDIHLTCICIGGPLNDNALGYTAKQLVPWRRIADLADT